jgi:anti-sigma factor RsiW
MSKYCRRSEDLSAYLDGELDEKTRLNLEMHLGDCFACKEMLQDLRCLHGYFQGLPHQEVGFDLAPVVLAELGRRAPPTRWPLQLVAAVVVSSRPWPRFRWAYSGNQPD